MRSIRIGKIAGFEINIDWSWLIVFALVVYSLGGFYFPNRYPELTTGISWLVGTISALLLFTSVLVHEMMHSVVAKRYGIDIQGITLFIFGGVAQTKSEPKTPMVEFLMAAAGPATSFVIAGLFYALAILGTAAGWPLAITAATGYLGMINLILAIFNMVPGFPLDGGRILRSMIWGWTHNLVKATQYASYTGQGFGYLLIVYGVYNIFGGGLVGGLWFVFIGWFLAGAARSSYEQVLVKEALSGVEVEKVMTTDIPAIAPETSVAAFVEDYLMRQDYSNFPVVHDDQVEGMVGVEEVKAVPRDEWQTTTVGQITHPIEDDERITKEASAWDALLQLSGDQPRRLLVMHDTKLDGTVTQDNILRVVRARTQLGF